MAEIFRTLLRSVVRFFYRIEQKLFGGLGLGRLPFAQHVKRALFTSVQPEAVHIDGLTIHHGGVFGLLDLTTYKAPVADALRRELRPGSRALDLGANVGYFTCRMSRFVGPRGNVTALEPDPENLSLLRKNVSENHLQNVTVVPKAVSDASGELTLFTSGAHSSSGFDAVRGGAARPVPVVTLDDLFHDAPPKVDLIKMDIIGSEAKALVGMRKLLFANPHIKILSAFCPAFLRDAGSDPARYLGELFALGFRVFDITNGDRAPVRAENAPQFVERYSPRGRIAQAEIFCVR